MKWRPSWRCRAISGHRASSSVLGWKPASRLGPQEDRGATHLQRRAAGSSRMGEGPCLLRITVAFGPAATVIARVRSAVLPQDGRVPGARVLVAQTHVVCERDERLLALLADAQTRQRAFLLTGARRTWRSIAGRHGPCRARFAARVNRPPTTRASSTGWARGGQPGSRARVPRRQRAPPPAARSARERASVPRRLRPGRRRNRGTRRPTDTGSSWISGLPEIARCAEETLGRAVSRGLRSAGSARFSPARSESRGSKSGSAAPGSWPDTIRCRAGNGWRSRPGLC